MSILPITQLSRRKGYRIERSLRFNSADSAYLSRTPSVAGNRRTWTWSGWVKRSTFGVRQAVFTTSNAPGNNYLGLEFNANDKLIFVSNNESLTEQFRLETNAVFRDPSAWYHIVVFLDTAQATASNRAAIYINGVLQTYSTATYMPQNYDGRVNTTNQHNLSSWLPTNNVYLNGYMTEINFIDGQALTPTSFGEFDNTTGVWKPKKYTGTYGTNGFYLNFSNNSATTATTLGKDSSGNNNNWTPNNFSVTAGSGNDSLIDTPTPYADGGNGRGNYCTLNPLDTGSATLTNGNLDVSMPSSGYGAVRGTIGVSSGKWYWEVTPTSLSAGTQLGIAGVSAAFSSSTQIGALSTGYSYIDSGHKYGAGVYTFSYGASFTTSDVIGVALDLDTGTLTFYKNGTSQGSAFTGLSGTFSPAISDNSTSASSAFTFNFGQRPFAYTAPSGFKALCTTNLPEPTIKKGAEQFNVVTYTGNGGTNFITGVGFGPGLTWIKSRSAATDHALYDTVRGVTKQLESNTTTIETTESTGLTSFGTDGFTVGSLAQLNTSGATYVGWNWKGGGTAVTNTQGTITSQVSANPSAGFSIVTYTGNLSSAGSSTVGHGLGVTPKMIVTKRRDNTSNWVVQFTSLGQNKLLLLDTTDSTLDSVSLGGGTLPLPTSTTFGISYITGLGINNQTHVGYVFAEIPGYSAFGSYTGNGSTDGPFVYLGFRPRFIIVKRTDNVSGGDWTLWDSSRNTFNIVNSRLYTNVNAEENTVNTYDFVSNGFKVRQVNGSTNNISSGTYIYAAFAENPFKYSLAR